jgi:RND family efflux transporter MFP subunit
MSESGPDPRPRRGARFALYVFGLALAVAAAAGAAWLADARTRGTAQARATLAAELALGPRVEVATVQPGPTTRTITLLGDARPYMTTTIFAKIPGYLRSVKVDKGDVVHAGDVLAEIDSAETDSLYASALADMENKTKLADRGRRLLATGNESVQAEEQSETDLRIAQQNVRNLATMRSYEQLRAPFDGVITARFADPGALLQGATTNQSSSLPVLAISDTSRLRIGAYIEQGDVPSVHVGDAVVVSDAANPDRQVTARISRNAGMLDPRTRTLMVEIDVDNRAGFLLPGAFAYVAVQVPRAGLPQIPVAALVQRGGTSAVAVVGDDGVVRFRPVKVASTDGLMISVAEGLAPGERVALNVPNDVTDGVRIRPLLASR